MKKLISAFIVLSCVFFCFASPSKEVKKTNEYVASTSWVASIAQLAGIDNIMLIAPANLKHPPEYEITPDDMVKVANAKLFLHAGYERMMKTISKAAEVDPDKILKVKTTNTLANLSNMVSMLSEKAGTVDIAKKRFEKFVKLIEDARQKIALSDVAVFANTNQAELAQDLGMNVVSTFGPGELSASQIEDAARNQYVLIIDNYHNPVASPLKQVCPSAVILEWKNFPEKSEENALFNVIKANLDMLWETGLF